MNGLKVRMDHEYWREQILTVSDELLEVMTKICIGTILATPEESRTGLGIPICALVSEYKKRGIKLSEEATEAFAPVLRQALKEIEKDLQRLKDALQETTKEMN